MIPSDPVAAAAAAAASAGIVLALPAFPSGKTVTSSPDPCHRCSTPAYNLAYLPSSFRIALLCPPCLAAVSSSLSCLYCLSPFTSSDHSACRCRCCLRRVHTSCIPAFHWSLPPPVPNLFVCVDCCPYVRVGKGAGAPKCEAGLRKACIVDTGSCSGAGGTGIACSLDDNDSWKCEPDLREARIADADTGLGLPLAESVRGDGGSCDGIACSRVLSIENEAGVADPDEGAGLREACIAEAARESGGNCSEAVDMSIVDMALLKEEDGSVDIVLAGRDSTLAVSARGDVGSGSGEVGMGVCRASVSGRRPVELGAKENGQDSDGLRRVRRLGDSDRHPVKYSRKCEADIVGTEVFQDSVRKNGGSCSGVVGSMVPSKGNFFDGIMEKKEMEQGNGEASLRTAYNVDIKSSGRDFPLDVTPRGDGGSCSGAEEMVIGDASRSSRRPIELSASGAGHDSNGSWQAQRLDDSVRYAVKYSRRR